jgi:hypothetical protein
MALRFGRYGRRFWGVYEDDELLCVTVYKKGALAVIRKMESIAPQSVPKSSVSCAASKCNHT